MIAFWNFVKPCSESLLTWNRARAKVNGNLADTAFPLPVWPSKEKIKEHLPDSFKGKYENERGILDCTPKEKLSNSPGQVE